MRHLTDHLKTSFGDSRAPGEIESAVATAYAAFEDLPIRTCVPVLVERQSRRILSEHSGCTPRTARLGEGPQFDHHHHRLRRTARFGMRSALTPRRRSRPLRGDAPLARADGGCGSR
ncbi:three-helix bundle dimerization domain-containing protein [Streptomyces sp. NPDC048179]|uniref:three-helix bundle dimerization domain-containing protein n=1 Tax=Streptomyces sp. NPDC048179 TaxID=3365506 RepID=UPI0037101396